MTETYPGTDNSDPPYEIEFDPHDAEQRPDRLTDAQLDNLEQAARASYGTDERSKVLINGVLSLIKEVRDLRKQVAQLTEVLEVMIE